MDRELERKIKRMTDEGLKDLEFNTDLKKKVREKVKTVKPYRRRWYAPVISFLIVLLLVFFFAVVKGEKLGFIGSERLSGFFENSSNFDIEIIASHGPAISTFDGTITRGDEVKPISFTKEERDEIYEKIESIGFKKGLNLPDGENCNYQAYGGYELKLRMNDDLYEYHYSGCYTTKDSRAVDELYEMVIDMIKERPGYEEMVEPYLMMLEFGLQTI
ncbi:hypothetical protein LCM10_13095 [Rossellomorea aquimaris]|uniref:hypothetical protein n=1 Tax=Rossellomorea aquimaris TaxID=189382 RepID=UPI001CD6DDF8|nr:hypothetical protein [Rossellomorea aquimaris]MCA1055927.1 hypothetical protein [Rossellomorea aquimaris]